MPTPELHSTSTEATLRDSGASLERIWHKALGFLQAELPRSSFETWIRDAEPVSFDGNLFRVRVANEYARDHLESHYSETIRRVLAMVLGQAVDVQFVVGEGADGQEETIAIPESAHASALLTNQEESVEDRQTLEVSLRFRRYWESIVDPEKVVSISRYFVKYWLPILGPHFSSTVLAFKQLRFLHRVQPGQPFEVYVSEILQWHGVKKSSFYRQLEKPHPLLSWFVEEAPTVGIQYEHPKRGKIRQKPKKYIVYGGVSLCPPHQVAVRKLLIDLGADQGLKQAIAALETALKLPDSELRELLDNSYLEYLESGYVNHPDQAFTVLDIAREVLTARGFDAPVDQIALLADQLENKCVRPDQSIHLTWYFVREWQPLLTNSAFWLVVLLRGMGFYDKRTLEIRNTFWVDGGYAELGTKIGVSSETISGWFGNNRKSGETKQSKFMRLFVHELERTRGRNENNRRGISVKLNVEMVDPLTPEGEGAFHQMAQGDGYELNQISYLLKGSPEKWDSSKGDYPEKREPDIVDYPEIWDSRNMVSPEITESRKPIQAENWDGIQDSIRTSSEERTNEINTYDKTTTQSVNQLILPLIYKSDSARIQERSSSRNIDWDLEHLLRANNISPDSAQQLSSSGVSARDFLAWILYGFSQEGRGIEKPGFFTVSRLLQVPPALPHEKWLRLAGKSHQYMISNIQKAADPFDVADGEWVRVMGKVSRDRLGSLAIALGLNVDLSEVGEWG